MINEQQKGEFDLRGLLYLPGLLDADIVTTACESMFRSLDKSEFRHDGQWALAQLDSKAGSRAAQLMKRLKKSSYLKQLITPHLRQLVLQLTCGEPATELIEHPQILFTLPNANNWSIPHNVWHLDIPRLPNVGMAGVQMFTFLNNVPPTGGGTLMVAGSHRLLNTDRRIASKTLKYAFREKDWFRRLMDKNEQNRIQFMSEPGLVDDVEVQVVELHGNPGDVYMTDMRLLHTLAPNSTPEPRIMVTQRFVMDRFKAILYDPNHPGNI